MVQIVKAGLRKQELGNMNQRLATVLLHYRRMPLATMSNISPAELIFNRRIKTQLDLLRNQRVAAEEVKQEKWPVVHKRDNTFASEDAVFMRKYTGGNKWTSGVVQQQHSPHTILVKQQDGTISHHSPRQMPYRAIDIPNDDDSLYDDIVTPPQPVVKNQRQQPIANN